MREFQTAMVGTVDLDDPKTYEYLGDNDVRRLDDIMFKEIGQALVYMDYFHPDIFPKKKVISQYKYKEDVYPETKNTEHGKEQIEFTNTGYYQRVRVNKLIKKFAKERKNNWENPMWFKEQIFIFQDETENMC
jgi:hypothetical protein